MANNLLCVATAHPSASKDNRKIEESHAIDRWLAARLRQSGSLSGSVHVVAEPSLATTRSRQLDLLTFTTSKLTKGGKVMERTFGLQAGWAALRGDCRGRLLYSTDTFRYI